MPTEFEKWLDPDPRRSQERLARIREKLFSKFGSRWYFTNEDVQDCVQETLKRVIGKVETDPKVRSHEPEDFVNAVANNVLKEKLDEIKRRRKREEEPIDDGIPTENPEDQILTEMEQEQLRNCLYDCMSKLTPVERNIVIERFPLANGHPPERSTMPRGAWTTAKRVRLHRIIRHRLKPCMNECINRGQP